MLNSVISFATLSGLSSEPSIFLIGDEINYMQFLLSTRWKMPMAIQNDSISTKPMFSRMGGFSFSHVQYKLPSAGGVYILVNIYTSLLSSQIKLSLVLAPLSPYFNAEILKPITLWKYTCKRNWNCCYFILQSICPPPPPPSTSCSPSFIVVLLFQPCIKCHQSFLLHNIWCHLCFFLRFCS